MRKIYCIDCKYYRLDIEEGVVLCKVFIHNKNLSLKQDYITPKMKNFNHLCTDYKRRWFLFWKEK